MTLVRSKKTLPQAAETPPRRKARARTYSVVTTRTTEFRGGGCEGRVGGEDDSVVIHVGNIPGVEFEGAPMCRPANTSGDMTCSSTGG